MSVIFNTLCMQHANLPEVMSRGSEYTNQNFYPQILDTFTAKPV